MEHVTKHFNNANISARRPDLARRLYQRNKERILDALPDVNIADMLGKNSEGTVNRGSKLFYLLPHIAGRLMDNDPDKVLSRLTIKIRRDFVYPLVLVFGKYFLGGTKQIFEKQEPLPKGRPLIFTPNHGFVLDAICSALAAKEHSYVVFGTLSHFFNTGYGVAAYLNGCLLINRKDKTSKQALIDKAVRALNLGTNVMIFPEGAWNKSPNLLLLNYWSGVFRIAKQTNALIVPIVHLPVGNKIYSSRLAPFDPSSYADEDFEEALATLRDIMSTELMELMSKYSVSTRAEIMGDSRTMHEACERIISEQVRTAGRFYDCEIETGNADFRSDDASRPGDVWRPIAELEINAQNAAAVLYARQMVAEDYQHRF